MSGEARLFRQITPVFLTDSVLSRDAFIPTTKDRGKLSVDNGALVTPYDSWHNYTKNQDLKSVGVATIDGNTCVREELPVIPDELSENPYHTLIDFTHLSKSERRMKAQILRDEAVRSGLSLFE